VLTAETLGDATRQSPSLADVFYLGFYPLTYVALVLLMRCGGRRLTIATWLDGAVAGLGAAALCASFVFSSVLSFTGNDALGVAANLAYPVGRLLLLALVFGLGAVVSGARKTMWLLLATACGLNAIGDTINLF